jgi:hypothetical protein
LHIKDRVPDETVEVCEIPDRSKLSKFLLHCGIERSRRDELDIRCKYGGQFKVLVGNTHKRIPKDAVLLEDGHGNWEVLLNDLLDKCLMGVLRLAIVSECIFQRLASSLFRTSAILMASWWIMWCLRIILFIDEGGEIPFLFSLGNLTLIMVVWTLVTVSIRLRRNRSRSLPHDG